MKAEYFHVCMASSFWVEALVTGRMGCRTRVLYWDGFFDDYLERWVDNDRVRFL